MAGWGFNLPCRNLKIKKKWPYLGKNYPTWNNWIYFVFFNFKFQENKVCYREAFKLGGREYPKPNYRVSQNTVPTHDIISSNGNGLRIWKNIHIITNMCSLKISGERTLKVLKNLGYSPIKSESEFEKHKSLKIEGWLEGAQSGMNFADMQYFHTSYIHTFNKL